MVNSKMEVPRYLLIVVITLSLDFANAKLAEKMPSAPRVQNLRLMTFNLWWSGSKVNNGLEKVARHIETLKPDIVALQELKQVHSDKLLSLLPQGLWNQCNATAEGAGDNLPFIITRYPVQKHYQPLYGFRHVACKVLVEPKDPELYVNVWNLHLPPEPYSPYTACFENCPSNPNDIKDRLIDGEYDPKNKTSEKRLNAVHRLGLDGQFDANLRNADVEPLVVIGDFNVPSHLDWTEPAKSTHCDVVFEWPVSKFFENKGLIDSFRQLHPCPVTTPGNTWTTVHRRNPENPHLAEPQDRIDFILYKSKSMKPIRSFLYSGDKKISEFPDHLDNDWPSDHYAVITDFEIY